MLPQLLPAYKTGNQNLILTLGFLTHYGFFFFVVVLFLTKEIIADLLSCCLKGLKVQHGEFLWDFYGKASVVNISKLSQ